MYVTVPSHSSKKEFPNNHASSFKIRLAELLHLLGEGWQVGLASISIPDRGINLTHITPYDQPVFFLSSVRKKKDNSFDYKFHKLVLKELKDTDWIRDGVTFMKASIQWLQQQQSLEFRREYESVEKHGENHTYFKFTWDGNDLLLDNSKLV